jgi:hypothetical protein
MDCASTTVFTWADPAQDQSNRTDENTKRSGAKQQKGKKKGPYFAEQHIEVLHLFDRYPLHIIQQFNPRLVGACLPFLPPTASHHSGTAPVSAKAKGAERVAKGLCCTLNMLTALVSVFLPAEPVPPTLPTVAVRLARSARSEPSAQPPTPYTELRS